MKKSLKILIWICLILLNSNSIYSQINLLSGLENGTYFNLAKDIQKISSNDLKVLNSNGSSENFKLLMEDNDINITFIQYDVLLANEMINTNLRNQLRVLLPLFIDEEIHLVTSKDSDIDKLNDLKHKKVGVGSKEQGTRITAQMIKNRTGIAWEDVIINSNDAFDALMKGEIDAYFYVGGTPIQSLKDMNSDANLKLVNIKHKALKKIYKKKKIKKGAYPWMTKSVKTFAVPTLLVVKVNTIDKEEEKEINALRTEILENISKLQKTGHIKWRDVYVKKQYIDWPYYYQRAVVE